MDSSVSHPDVRNRSPLPTSLNFRLGAGSYSLCLERTKQLIRNPLQRHCSGGPHLSAHKIELTSVLSSTRFCSTRSLSWEVNEGAQGSPQVGSRAGIQDGGSPPSRDQHGKGETLHPRLSCWPPASLTSILASLDRSLKSLPKTG